jgi:hypothetical protein
VTAFGHVRLKRLAHWAAFSAVPGHRVRSGVASPRPVASPGVSLRSPPNAPLLHAPQPAGKTTTCGSRISPPPVGPDPGFCPPRLPFRGMVRYVGQNPGLCSPPWVCGPCGSAPCCSAFDTLASSGSAVFPVVFSAVSRRILRRLPDGLAGGSLGGWLLRLGRACREPWTASTGCLGRGCTCLAPSVLGGGGGTRGGRPNSSSPSSGGPSCRRTIGAILPTRK